MPAKSANVFGMYPVTTKEITSDPHTYSAFVGNTSVYTGGTSESRADVRRAGINAVKNDWQLRERLFAQAISTKASAVQ